MSNPVRCTDCANAEWTTTPSGRIKKGVAGRCWALHPSVPIVLHHGMNNISYPRQGSSAIWPDAHGRCDLFKAK